MHREIFDFDFRCQTGSGLFFQNRKFQSSKPEVENVLDEKRVKFCCVSTILLFWYFEQGRRQRLLKNFVSYVTVYGYTRTKMILPVTRIESWKLKSLQKLASFPMRHVSTSGSDLFNFWFAKNSELPVWGRKRKSKISRCIILRSTLYILKVSSKSAHGCRRSNFPHLKWTPS